MYIQYTYIVGKYKIYLYELQKQAEQRAFIELFRPVSQRVQMNFTFKHNVRMLCLSCNVKKVGKLVRFRQKGQKQALFLAFINVVKGVFFVVRATLVPVSYLSAPSAVHSYRVPGTFIRRLKSLFVQYEKFIRLVRIKQIFIRIAYLYSKCTDCRIKLGTFKVKKRENQTN